MTVAPQRSARRSATSRSRRARSMGTRARRRLFPVASIPGAVTVTGGNSPIPTRLITRMKYSQHFPIAAGVGPHIQKFRLNSIYDPDYTGAGHQPYGFDTYELLYSRYRVFSASWVLKADNIEQSDPVTFVLVPSNVLGATTSVEQSAEMPRAKWRICAPGVQAVLNGRINLASLNGQSSTEFRGNDRVQSQVSTNPAEVALLNIIAQGTGNTGVYTCAYHITIMYHVEFFDPVALAQS